MNKIDFTDMTVFEKLEDEAIDGVLNYDDFPPEEYKYFSKLAKLGYCNRNKGWDIDICLKKQEEYRTDYSEEKAYANRFVAMFKRYNDNNIKVQELETKMYKAQNEDEMLCLAIKIIEKLLDENGFEERMTKKLKGMNALKKRIPRKVIRSIYNVCFCPICKGSVWQNKDESKYCFRCGQALKWESKKDD